MEAFNQFNRSTSIISDLNFELMRSRTDYLKGLIDQRVEAYWLNDILPGPVRFLETNLTFYEFFKTGSYFDPNMMGGSSDRALLDRFGNAALIHANAELAWGNQEIFGSHMGTWVAGGAEFGQRAAVLWNNLTGSTEIDRGTGRYFEEMLSDPYKIYSRAFDNDMFDYSINEETAQFIEFQRYFDAMNLIDEILTGHPETTPVIDIEHWSAFDETDLFFRDNYELPYGMGEERPDWGLGIDYDWDLESFD